MPVVSHKSFHPLLRKQETYANVEMIGKPGYRLAPSLTLNVYRPGEKTPIKAELLEDHLASVVFEEDIKMASELKIVIANPDRVVSESDIFQAGGQVDVAFGYESSSLFSGRRTELVKFMPDFPRDGVPELKLHGYDARHWMSLGDKVPKYLSGAAALRFKKVPSRFKNKRDDEMISIIADAYGMSVDADRTEGRRTRVKKRETSDWEFILRLAKLNGFWAWVDWDDEFPEKFGWVLHFRRREMKQNDYYIFEYKPDEDDPGPLLDVELELEVTKQSTDVEVLTYDRRLRKISTAVLSENKEVDVGSYSGGLSPKLRHPLLTGEDYGAKVRFTVFGRTMEVIGHRPFRDKKDARRFAEEWLAEREGDFLTATGTLFGVENVRPRQIHKLIGMGANYDGFYLFDQVEQKWEKGGAYETPFVGHRVVSELALVHRKVKMVTQIFDAPAIDARGAVIPPPAPS